MMSLTGPRLYATVRHGSRHAMKRARTEVTGKQSFFPSRYLRYPVIQHEQSGNPAEEQDGDKEHNQSPRQDAEVGGVEGVEW